MRRKGGSAIYTPLPKDRDSLTSYLLTNGLLMAALLIAVHQLMHFLNNNYRILLPSLTLPDHRISLTAFLIAILVTFIIMFAWPLYRFNQNADRVSKGQFLAFWEIGVICFLIYQAFFLARESWVASYKSWAEHYEGYMFYLQEELVGLLLCFVIQNVMSSVYLLPMLHLIKKSKPHVLQAGALLIIPMMIVNMTILFVLIFFMH